LRVRQLRPVCSPLRQSAKDIHPALAQFCVGNRLPHEVRNDRAFVLSSEGFIEFGFDVIGDAEIHGGHMRRSIVEDFNKANDIGIRMAVKPAIPAENAVNPIPGVRT
jgi:hypothetical protein